LDRRFSSPLATESFLSFPDPFVFHRLSIRLPICSFNKALPEFKNSSLAKNNAQVSIPFFFYKTFASRSVVRLWIP
jgi:hypothetical protein